MLNNFILAKEPSKVFVSYGKVITSKDGINEIVGLASVVKEITDVKRLRTSGFLHKSSAFAPVRAAVPYKVPKRANCRFMGTGIPKIKPRPPLRPRPSTNWRKPAKQVGVAIVGGLTVNALWKLALGDAESKVTNITVNIKAPVKLNAPRVSYAAQGSAGAAENTPSSSATVQGAPSDSGSLLPSTLEEFSGLDFLDSFMLCLSFAVVFAITCSLVHSLGAFSLAKQLSGSITAEAHESIKSRLLTAVDFGLTYLIASLTACLFNWLSDFNSVYKEVAVEGTKVWFDFLNSNLAIFMSLLLFLTALLLFLRKQVKDDKNRTGDI